MTHDSEYRPVPAPPRTHCCCSTPRCNEGVARFEIWRNLFECRWPKTAPTGLCAQQTAARKAAVETLEAIERAGFPRVGSPRRRCLPNSAVVAPIVSVASRSNQTGSAMTLANMPAPGAATKITFDPWRARPDPGGHLLLDLALKPKFRPTPTKRVVLLPTSAHPGTLILDLGAP